MRTIQNKKKLLPLFIIVLSICMFRLLFGTIIQELWDMGLGFFQQLIPHENDYVKNRKGILYVKYKVL